MDGGQAIRGIAQAYFPAPFFFRIPLRDENGYPKQEGLLSLTAGPGGVLRDAQPRSTSLTLRRAAYGVSSLAGDDRVTPPGLRSGKRSSHACDGVGIRPPASGVGVTSL